VFASEQLRVSAQIGTCLKEENKIDCRTLNGWHVTDYRLAALRVSHL
jgi:hypothetical protein